MIILLDYSDTMYIYLKSPDSDEPVKIDERIKNLSPLFEDQDDIDELEVPNSTPELLKLIANLLQHHDYNPPKITKPI